MEKSPDPNHSFCSLSYDSSIVCSLSYDSSIASSKVSFPECDLVLPLSISGFVSFP